MSAFKSKRVGILGLGEVGRTLGSGFIKLGHQVMLGTLDPYKAEVREWLRRTPGAKAGAFEEATRFGELLVLAALGLAVLTNVRL